MPAQPPSSPEKLPALPSDWRSAMLLPRFPSRHASANHGRRNCVRGDRLRQRSRQALRIRNCPACSVASGLSSRLVVHEVPAGEERGNLTTPRGRGGVRLGFPVLCTFCVRFPLTGFPLRLFGDLGNGCGHEFAIPRFAACHGPPVQHGCKSKERSPIFARCYYTLHSEIEVDAQMGCDTH